MSEVPLYSTMVRSWKARVQEGVALLGTVPQNGGQLLGCFPKVGISPKVDICTRFI